jgi:hypothetical protein
MAVSLSELQKVGDELAATSGHRSGGAARIIYRHREIFVTAMNAAEFFETISKRKF